MVGALIAFLAVAADNPHQQAEICRRAEPLSESCRLVCYNCHSDGSPPDIYHSGDRVICVECHQSETDEPNSGKLLFRREGAGGGNHPNAVDYDPFDPARKLSTRPIGPKFFFDEDGGNPRLYCSSCHDVMGAEPYLLRIPKVNSAICLSCHLK